MKTQIITLIAAIVLVTGIANTTKAATVKSVEETEVSSAPAINKIEVRGNVQLYISDGETDKIKVNSKYYSDNALAKGANGVLRITSYNAEKLIVWVTARDLRSVSAYDNAEVKSFGTLSKIEFSVDLHNNATAKLNLDTYSATVTVNNAAKAELTGTTIEYDLKCNHFENVNQKDFKAQHASKILTINAFAVTMTQLNEFANL